MFDLMKDFFASVFFASFFWIFPMYVISPYNPIIRMMVDKYGGDWYKILLNVTHFIGLIIWVVMAVVFFCKFHSI